MGTEKMRSLIQLRNLVTVVVPTKNNAKQISAVVRRASKYFRTVIVDSNSQDGTLDLAVESGAEVVTFNWDGNFPKKRNWALRNIPIHTPWVLFLDADELITDSFAQELLELLPKTGSSGFILNYENRFMGRTLKHGDPFRKLALFRIGAGEYEHIDEHSWSRYDMEIHEHPVVDGVVGTIKAPLIHEGFSTLRHHYEKHNEYSDWEAHRYWHLMSADRQIPLTKRQRTKYRLISNYWFSIIYFLYSFIFRGGVLDGSAGFHFAIAKSIYFYWCYLKIKHMVRYKS